MTGQKPCHKLCKNIAFSSALLFISVPGACSSAARAVHTSVKLAHNRCRTGQLFLFFLSFHSSLGVKPLTSCSSSASRKSFSFSTASRCAAAAVAAAAAAWAFEVAVPFSRADVSWCVLVRLKTFDGIWYTPDANFFDFNEMPEMIFSILIARFGMPPSGSPAPPRKRCSFNGLHGSCRVRRCAELWC